MSFRKCSPSGWTFRLQALHSATSREMRLNYPFYDHTWTVRIFKLKLNVTYFNSSIVLVSKDISVTCRVARQGTVEWWLTQESGQSPVCKNNRCSRCKPVQQARELKQAYLVLVLDHPGELVWSEPLRRIALAKLSVDALDIASHTIIPTVLEKSANRRLPVVRSLFRLFRHGLFSSSLGCGCSVDLGVCKKCTKCEQVRFIWENGFSRVFPYGKCHWFRGVTDAVDQTFAENRWLRCSSICLEDHPELI